jgi:hypothetical protein
MRSAVPSLVRVGAAAGLVVLGLFVAPPAANAVSTGCASMNDVGLDGTYNVGTLNGDFETGEVLTLSVTHPDALVATFDASQTAHAADVGYVPETVLTPVPGRITYVIPSSARYDLTWSVTLPGAQDPTWFVSCNADADLDGVPDASDNCVQVPNADQSDVDGDGLGDACDSVNNDLDGDGIPNDFDNCPNAANPNQADTDGDGTGDACDLVNDDPDGDGVFTEDDNCPDVANPSQSDADEDGAGDACDDVNDDVDSDGVPNAGDNCPTASNPGQSDTDGDGLGDACDPVDDDDTDGDGVPSASDNCPTTANPGQADTDDDGLGDACDAVDDDPDGDGVLVGDDNCPDIANPGQADADHDGVGDACEPTADDNDGDGVANSADNCPASSNPDQLDSDHDGVGNACDTDDDNDGVPDAADACPLLSGTRSNGCLDRAPTVSIGSPGLLAALDPRLTTTITATATDDVGVSTVTFVVGSRTVCVDTTVPYACAWRPTEHETGTQVITVTARDGKAATARASRGVVVKRFTPTLKVAVAKVPKKATKLVAKGTLLLPSGTTVAACTGAVKVQLTGDKHTRTVQAKLKKVGRTCTFTTAAFTRYKVVPKARASFAGNAILAAAKSR